MIDLAAAHSASTRVLVWLAGIVVFALLATGRWRRRSNLVAALAVLLLIAVGWLFGATLVWGTAASSKVRLSGSWTHHADAWQWTGLLVLGMVGVLSVGLSLRSFARGAQRPGWLLAATAGSAFVLWSGVVRYPVVIAIFVVATGYGALRVVSRGKEAIVTSEAEHGPRLKRGALALVITTVLVAIGWVFYALAWAVVGPEGNHTLCGCWADNYNDWQYQAQFLVALVGGLSLVGSAALYVSRGRRPLVAGTVTGVAVCGWLAFLITGTA